MLDERGELPHSVGEIPWGTQHGELDPLRVEPPAVVSGANGASRLAQLLGCQPENRVMHRIGKQIAARMFRREFSNEVSIETGDRRGDDGDIANSRSLILYREPGGRAEVAFESCRRATGSCPRGGVACEHVSG